MRRIAALLLAFGLAWPAHAAAKDQTFEKPSWPLWLAAGTSIGSVGIGCCSSARLRSISPPK
ncbi:MAG: hypothetical protein D6771_04635 [Zetaproteobacteria bacterium]|nr:MAG: hypothetical protein D6771_04635 [Zetaproteobacteria bacterium]